MFKLHGEKSKALKRRIISGALSACLAIGLTGGVSFGSTAAEAADDNAISSKSASKGEVYLWEWTKVKNYSDLPQTGKGLSLEDYAGRLLFLWNSNGRLYGTAGNTRDNNWIYIRNIHHYDGDTDNMNCIVGFDFTNDQYVSDTEDNFVTTDDRNAFQFFSNGYQDKSNSYAKEFYVRSALLTNGEYVYMSSDDDSVNAFTFRNYYRNCDGSHHYFEMYIKNAGQNNAKVTVFHNHSGNKDDDWGYDGRYVYCDSTGDDIDDLDEFTCYVGRRVKYDCIGDYTVEKGKVLNIDDNIILNGTLTVEPGAVVSVEGRFFNNGVINNYGTVIVQENSCISTLDPSEDMDTRISDKSTVGTINNYGGNTAYTNGEYGEGALIILKDGKLCLSEGYGAVTLSGGATLVNNGIVILPGGISASQSSIWNRENGTMFLGYQMAKNITSLPDMKITGSGSAATLNGLAAATEKATVQLVQTRVVNDGNYLLSNKVSQKEVSDTDDGYFAYAITFTYDGTNSVYTDVNDGTDNDSKNDATQETSSGSRYTIGQTYTEYARLTVAEAIEQNTDIKTAIDQKRAQYVADKMNDAGDYWEWYYNNFERSESKAIVGTDEYVYWQDLIYRWDSSHPNFTKENSFYLMARKQYDDEFYTWLNEYKASHNGSSPDTGYLLQQENKYWAKAFGHYFDMANNTTYGQQELAKTAKTMYPYTFWVYQGDASKIEKALLEAAQAKVDAPKNEALAWINSYLGTYYEEHAFKDELPAPTTLYYAYITGGSRLAPYQTAISETKSAVSEYNATYAGSANSEKIQSIKSNSFIIKYGITSYTGFPGSNSTSAKFAGDMSGSRDSFLYSALVQARQEITNTATQASYTAEQRLLALGTLT